MSVLSYLSNRISSIFGLHSSLKALAYKMVTNSPENRIIWFDGGKLGVKSAAIKLRTKTEMTGLELDQRLVEVAAIITEADLTVRIFFFVFSIIFVRPLFAFSPLLNMARL